jgi:hypothetical protein
LTKFCVAEIDKFREASQGLMTKVDGFIDEVLNFEDSSRAGGIVREFYALKDTMEEVVATILTVPVPVNVQRIRDIETRYSDVVKQWKAYKGKFGLVLIFRN